MLILARGVNDTIVLRDKSGKELAKIIVTEIHQFKIRLGVIAEPEVEIVRGELLKRAGRARPDEVAAQG